jgi:mono/diheme cytochrome c family protein
MILRLIKLGALFVALFMLTIAVATDSFAEGDAAAGMEIFSANCAVCHGADGHSPLAAAGMSVPNFADGDRLDKPVEERFNSVCKGLVPDPPTPPMPAFCDQLSEQDIHNALAYEESLHK